jgi:hypothetical protein
MDFSTISPHVYDIAGVFGFAIYVTNYTLLTTRFLSSNSVLYFCLNLTAATLVLLGLSVNFNLASALIQGFWVIMSVLGIALRILRPNPLTSPKLY